MPKSTQRKYTLPQIDTAWSDYRNGWCFRYLVAGEWKHSTLKPDIDPNNVITKMDRCRFKEVMSFPEYLRTKHG